LRRRFAIDIPTIISPTYFAPAAAPEFPYLKAAISNPVKDVPAEGESWDVEGFAMLGAASTQRLS
jgi:hypothetical protein